jgi:hypothetical protein
MLCRADVTTKVDRTLTFTGGAGDYTHVTVRNNSAGVTIDATEGIGEAASNSSVIAAWLGGFADMRVTAVMKYVSPTSQANSEIGVMGRFTSPASTGFSTASYVYARVDGGVAKLTEVVAGTLTTLSSTAYALPQDELCTITLTLRGTAWTASFNCTSLGTVSLSATSSNVSGIGVGGIRSLSSSIRCRTLRVEQL